MRFFELKCGYKAYPWGMIGFKSCIAQYISSAQSNIIVNENEPYAELWMGVHPSSPSFVRTINHTESLLSILINDEQLVSHNCALVYGKTLPFLFKVLSVRTALSIQAHPDRALAAILHDKYPEHYKDSNHKPEMAIALTSFEALCGFRPLNEIISFVRSVKALRELLGDIADTFINETENIQTELTINDRSILQKLLWTLLIQSKTHIEKCAEQLIIEIHKNKLLEKDSAYEVIIRLNEQFPKDVGLFFVFLLNHIRLEPGEGIFLQANTPHAYLCGEIVECMSSSDNVVRAGLTPKFKDIETFVSMLTYECSPASAQKMTPTRFDRTIGDGDVYLFKPPIDEFSVLQIHLKKDNVQTIEGLNGPSIMICTKGDGTVLAEEKVHIVRIGSVFFIGASVEIKLTSNSDSFVIYRAFVEV
ncbi:hypothetical protein PCANB_000055 [Pneumocystis canis]|nr:hypothetical protein PCK1_000138 [Pneumocystis canis]KAG5439773.1 hypothetical protein PCANB_000055 [Pneumocystis canis]